MKDFFDEDFPLTQKQEDELKKQQEAVADAETKPEQMTEQTASENNTAEDFFADDDKTVIFAAEDSDVPEQIEFDPIDHAPIIDIDGDGINDRTYPDMFDEHIEEVAPEVVFQSPSAEDAAVEPTVDDSIAEYEEHIAVDEDDDLDAELEALHSRLSSIERTVNAITAESDDEQADDEEVGSFTYSYDERYFAEDETPAYKHPEIVKAHRASKNTAKRISKDDITLNVKTLAKVGAAVAGAIVALKLLSDDSKK